MYPVVDVLGRLAQCRCCIHLVQVHVLLNFLGISSGEGVGKQSHGCRCD